MIFLKLLISCLTFFTAKALFTDAQIELYEKYSKSFHKIIPEHYNIQLEPDIELNIFYGECNISIHILVPTRYLILYSKIKFINDIIMTDNPPRFHGWLIPTHFDVFGARQVFPCLGEYLQATFNITIKHHSNCAALSNMEVQKIERNDEDMALTHFKTTPRQPTYLIAGIVTNFYRASTKNIITNIWYRNCSALRMVFTRSIIEDITMYLENKWKSLKVLSKVNHLAIPNFQDMDMVNMGLVLYREEDIIYDDNLDPAARKIDVARIVGYKISQEWFYNVYDLVWASRGSFWFNKCLIKFLGTFAVHKRDLNFRDTLPCYWLNKTEPHLIDINFKEVGWVIFNIQQIGYYRVNYDLENWKRIARYLASKNYIKIHVLNRAQIIDDAFHFMITKQLDSSIFWNITEYLEQETNFVAWYPMFKALEYMSSVFPLPKEKTDKITRRMRSILYKVLQELGNEEILGEYDLTKRLRQEAAKWACFFGDQICIEVANYNLRQHLANPEENKLSPWWKEWTYCNGLKLMPDPHIMSYENSTWRAVHRMGKEKFKTKVLEFLICPEHPDFIIDYLNMIGNNSETSIMLLKDFRDQDNINGFLFTIAKYARKDKVLNFILNRLKKIKPKKINRAVTWTVLINHLYSKEQLKQTNKSVIKTFDKIGNYTRRKIQENLQGPLDNVLKITVKLIKQLKKAEQWKNKVLNKLDIRSHQIESQIKYLDNLIL
ncbi:glutamyl aminopeptidase-like [Polyergus mexicanus]|uniref:glutamyl aminopeptidase-like n=1 Tax=Polyergus mexicanus TaxID=615972 RepID=UPI0038B5CB14